MRKIVAGEAICAVAVTEPDAGSDVKGIRTTARRTNDGYVLNGTKMFITNGVHADLYCVAAKTGDVGGGSKAVTMLVFENCLLPHDAVLGDEGAGFYAIMKNFQNERTVIGAMAMGEAQAALELTVAYLKTRKAFGAPLWDKQAIRQRIAMRAAEVEAGRQLIYSAAWRDAQGQDVTREVSMAKAYCGELVNAVMYDCVQFHGGMGFMRESAIERMARDARVQAIGGGATEVMLEEVAKRL
jgi:acyl-CoA dehydrogenase